MEATTTDRPPAPLRFARLCLLAAVCVTAVSCGAPTKNTSAVVLDDQQQRVVTIQLAGIG